MLGVSKRFSRRPGHMMKLAAIKHMSAKEAFDSWLESLDSLANAIHEITERQQAELRQDIADGKVKPWTPTPEQIEEGKRWRLKQQRRQL